jgi:hypothetical protein
VVRAFGHRRQPASSLRDKAVSFPVQPVVADANLVFQGDTVEYFQLTDLREVACDFANRLEAIQQRAITNLCNVIGGMTLGCGALSSEREARRQWALIVLALPPTCPPTTED